MKEILKVLRTLNPEDDSQWTQQGLPKLDMLGARLGEEVTRQEVVDAAPEFNRDNIELPPETPPGPGDPPKEKPDPDSGSSESEKPEVTLEEANERLEKARVEQVAAEARSDAEILAKEATSEPGHITNMKNIRQWLNGQAKERARRAGVRIKILEKLDPKELQVISPLDQAMRRKTARGAARPEVPVKTQ